MQNTMFMGKEKLLRGGKSFLKNEGFGKKIKGCSEK